MELRNSDDPVTTILVGKYQTLIVPMHNINKMSTMNPQSESWLKLVWTQLSSPGSQRHIKTNLNYTR